jgi:hypothetical protein
MTTAGITAAAMSAGKAAIGGLAAAVLTNTVAKANETYAPYAGLLGAVATSLFLKQPEIAAGMAGYAGAKIGQSWRRNIQPYRRQFRAASKIG